MPEKYIDIDGYHIKKSFLKDEKELKALKKELTVCPTNNMYGESDIFHEQFKETSKEIIIPRYFGVKKYGNPEEKNIKFEPEKSTMNFISKLRDYQEPIVEKCINHILGTGGGQLSVPCGRGKTVMAIYIAYKLGMKTLIVVHQSFLQDQWIDRIKQFTGEEAGLIRQDKIKVDNKNIVVGMIQSIASRDYGDIFEQFGLVIYDECHHYASKWFSQAMSKLGARYTFGLSATLYRADGLVKVVHWYLGDVAYKEKTKTNNQVVVKVLNFNSKHKKFKETTRMVKGVRLPNCTKMLNNLVEIKTRDNMIIDVINTLRKDPERKILILSGRKDSHLPNLKKKVDEMIQKDIQDGKILEDECRTYYYTGNCKQKERFEAEKHADIIFATYHMAQEGLDIPRLNTVVLATPKKDVVQAVGRILRKELQNGDIRPLIVDIVDNVSIFPKQANVREKFYEQSDYILQYYYFLEDKFISPKEYLELRKETVTNNVCNTKPNSYDDLLQVPPVEIIIESNTDTNSSSSGSKSSSKSINSKKVKRLARPDEVDLDDVFDLPKKSKTSSKTTESQNTNKGVDLDDVFDLPKNSNIFKKKEKKNINNKYSDDLDDIFDLKK
jgi:superfamily II DNA or RNA helicase